MRGAYPFHQVATGADPQPAAMLDEAGVAPIDLDEVFERTLTRVIDSFA
ncbi:hypothetical protein [Streptomyces sp. NPDC002889]